MKFFHPLLVFLIHLGYFGPLAMGILDSSFLVLPFGNDLLVIWLVAQKHHGAAWYVLAAAAGSTLGALALALVSKRLGEQGVRKLAGDKQYDKLCRRIGDRSWLAVALGALAPPPFPYTLVVAAASAVNGSLPKILTANFFARAARFALLALLAMKFGNGVTRMMQSEPFEWTMAVFVVVCLVASGISVWKWVRHGRAKG